MWKSKGFKLVWVVLLAASCFTLGYTLKPKPSRQTMLRGRMPPAFSPAQQRFAPPIRMPGQP